MSTPLTINNKTFDYPSPGESPGWGEDATAWAEEVTTALQTVSGPGDIASTSATLSNNQASATNVTFLAFDTSIVRSAEIQYAITRSGTVSAVSVIQVEEGRLHIVYNGGSWEVSRIATGDAGVDFTVTNAGQVQYVSDDISAGAGVTGYVGKITFKAAALIQ